ncbi:MFS transporter [Zafaria cholistanensis]|uniref:MFS transporter n=1 Tax=Zafaria cholistanensis TaxID=1682741 RepID=A0A5A7NPS8_9MICC|nr:MFS transporter [Zafaria cholistanensis]GER21788.1 MFS transporter [Zafaria cholistanensis]
MPGTTRPPSHVPPSQAPADSRPAEAPAVFPDSVRDRNFGLFWAGQTLGQLGVQTGAVLLPVLAVSLLSAGDLEVGVLKAAQSLAFLVVGLPAGAWVDHWLKRGVMIRADLARFAITLAIPLLWYLGILQMWHLWACAALLGIATVFFDVAYQSAVPLLVDSRSVAQANARLEATGQASRLVGPALGGWLLHLVLAPVLFIGQAAGYLASAACLWGVRDREQPKAPCVRGRLWPEIREGLAYVVRHRLIKHIVAATAIMNFFSTIVFTLMPVLVLRTLGLDPAHLGMAYSAGAVGGLLAAAATPYLARRIGEGTVLPISTALTGTAMAGFPLSVLAPGPLPAFAVLAGSMFALTAGVLVYNILQVSLRQRICPPGLLGRANASIRFLVWGVVPPAALLAGVLGERLGTVPALWIGVAGSVAAALPLVFSPLARMRVLPDGPEEDGPEQEVSEEGRSQQAARRP